MNSCLPGTTRFTQFPASCLFLRLGAFFTMEFALILSGRSRSSALSSFLSVHHIVSGGLVLTHVTRVSLLEGLTQPSGRVRLTEYLSIYLLQWRRVPELRRACGKGELAKITVKAGDKMVLSTFTLAWMDASNFWTLNIIKRQKKRKNPFSCEIIRAK